MSKVMVVGLKSYSFENDQKQRVEGARVSYLTPIESNKSNEVGYLPLQVTIPVNMISSFSEVPGIYDVNFDMVPGRNNKPEIAITGFDFVKSVDYLGLFE